MTYVKFRFHFLYILKQYFFYECRVSISLPPFADQFDVNVSAKWHPFGLCRLPTVNLSEMSLPMWNFLGPEGKQQFLTSQICYIEEG